MMPETVKINPLIFQVPIQVKFCWTLLLWFYLELERVYASPQKPGAQGAFAHYVGLIFKYADLQFLFYFSKLSISKHKSP